MQAMEGKPHTAAASVLVLAGVGRRNVPALCLAISPAAAAGVGTSAPLHCSEHDGEAPNL